MYHELCLSGGGIKLISFIGTLKFLIHNNYINFKKIKRIIGVSAGSIFGFLISIGYSIQELEEFVLNFNFSKLLPKLNTEDLIFKYGLSDTETIKNVFKILLKKKLNITSINFIDLYNLSNIKLDVGVSNLTTNTFEIWNYKNTPYFSVIDAVAISCTIPIVFKPIKINNNIYVDGGVLNNFPIQYINKHNYSNIIGIVATFETKNNIDNIFDYLYKIVHTVVSNHNNIIIQNYKNIIDIITVNSQINTLEFNVQQDMLIKDIDSGYQQAKLFFQNKTKIKRRNSI